MRPCWGVTTVLSCTSVIALAEPCPAIVIVEGTPTLRDSIIAELAARGIAMLEQAGCASIRVQVTTDDAGISVAITDAVGRKDDLHVADLSMAASLIESRSRPDLEASLLAVRPSRSPLPNERETPAVLVRDVPAIAVHGPPIRVAFDAGSSLGSDGSVWLSLSGLACVRFGPLCPGVMVRVSQDTEVRGDSETLSTSRRAIDLGVVLDVPRTREGWSWTPGVQVGLAFDRRRFAPEVGPVSDTIETDGGSLRAGAHLGVAKQLTSRLALGLDLAVDTAVFSPADQPDRETQRLATQPRTFVRAGLELRYEGL